ncbi:uncharacterized protein LOC6576921 [Drosophila mojavensis]|uniref:Uncharacterized protein, isoform A n=1 Tax=Drosophila mojavensis TaxID=7230 RepID=B4KI50_DROMO|nr:uncharacterized protein LOC6576921 [Drosophila mojavensis]EDW12343.2 uncharacterized protein Dmoj_GI10476, isoform A [Drosophila mojavensis]KRG03201.1 uncharacterized protein Dmoj_GI10476, isoform B [Drosophila mojavensis]KRG03202.1 uncharacterized protein Dmoj_GI10476, isoform C [Drosophila mojavensis]
MCRCLQNCLEDCYWNCFEERFCYDESIANYNAEEDEEYLASQKRGTIIGRVQPTVQDNNHLLTVPQPICDQPVGLMSAKIHEEDYRRVTQTNVPMLGPEILAVFANSQIFQDHQPTKLNRISTKTFLAGVHSPNKEAPTTPRLSEQERLLRRLEAGLQADATDSTKAEPSAEEAPSPEKRITFTLAPSESSPEGSQSLAPKKFEPIAEEEKEDEKDTDEVILRPHLIDRHPHLLPSTSSLSSTPKRTLRAAKSVPQMFMADSDTDIFAITGTGSQISMTPEVPSISFSNLPKNYEDTPTIEKYRVSQSLYSIQNANAARASQDDYSMPRYFRRSNMPLAQSTEILPSSTSLASISASVGSTSSSKDELRRTEQPKSKRLQMLRGNLPPLLIHSVSFKRNREEGKQVD